MTIDKPDAGMLSVLEEACGGLFARAFPDHWDDPAGRGPGVDPEFLEMLQFSDLAGRFKTNIRTMIRRHRQLESLERLLLTQLHYTRRESEHLRRTIELTYPLYKTAWRDRLGMKTYRTKNNHKNKNP